MKVEDNPASLNSSSDLGGIFYGEDVYVGYRYYESVKRDVMFPFGYELSSTTLAETGTGGRHDFVESSNR